MAQGIHGTMGKRLDRMEELLERVAKRLGWDDRISDQEETFERVKYDKDHMKVTASLTWAEAEALKKFLESRQLTLEGFIRVSLKASSHVKGKTYSLQDVIDFGKYRDLQVLEVLKVNPGYFLWLESQGTHLKFSPEVLEAARQLEEGEDWETAENFNWN